MTAAEEDREKWRNFEKMEKWEILWNFRETIYVEFEKLNLFRSDSNLYFSDCEMLFRLYIQGRYRAEGNIYFHKFFYRILEAIDDYLNIIYRKILWRICSK